MKKKTEQQNQDIEVYNRTAGREQPMEEDNQPPAESLTPMVLLIIFVISIGFIGMLIWGIGIVFGT